MPVKEHEHESAIVTKAENDLPEGWVTCRFSDGIVTDVQPGFACGANNRAGVGVPHLRPMNVTTEGEISLSDTKYIPKSRVDSDRKWLNQGDVLFNNTNSTELVGKTAIYDLPEPRAFSNHMTRIHCHPEALDSRFCAMVLHYKWSLGYFAGVCSQHVSQSSIGRSVLLDTEIPLPPLTEQTRIVAKVEALLARASAARERLAKVPAILKRFRQSVLAAACSGQLTADWRDPQRCTETAVALLSRIRVERRQRWAAARSARRAYGRSSIQAASRGYVEPPPPEAAELPALADGWLWVRAEQVCDFITKGTTPPSDGMSANSGDVPFIKVYNLTHDGTLDFSVKPTFIGRNTHEVGPLARSRILPGDVLMNLVGPPLGKVSVVPDTYPEWNTNQAVAIYRTIPGMEQRFFAVALLTDSVLDWAICRSKATVGQHNLTLELARDLPVPLPPIEEQREIVRRVNALFAFADKIEARVQAATARVEKITQAILAKAFRGELVPTEAELARQEGRDYEPASVLLERIRAARATTEPTGRKRTTRRARSR